jgi:hypothetical protein
MSFSPVKLPLDEQIFPILENRKQFKESVILNKKTPKL